MIAEDAEPDAPLLEAQGTNVQPVETFNGTLRDECLNLNWFASLTEAQWLLDAWRKDYNESRPHSAFEHPTPAEYARKVKELEPA